MWQITITKNSEEQSHFEMLIVAWKFKMFPEFYGTEKPITVFTRAHH
jgi:hypothetical protein